MFKSPSWLACPFLSADGRVIPRMPAQPTCDFFSRGAAFARSLGCRERSEQTPGSEPNNPSPGGAPGYHVGRPSGACCSRSPVLGFGRVFDAPSPQATGERRSAAQNKSGLKAGHQHRPQKRLPVGNSRVLDVVARQRVSRLARRASEGRVVRRRSRVGLTNTGQPRHDQLPTLYSNRPPQPECRRAGRPGVGRGVSTEPVVKRVVTMW